MYAQLQQHQTVFKTLNVAGYSRAEVLRLWWKWEITVVVFIAVDYFVASPFVAPGRSFRWRTWQVWLSENTLWPDKYTHEHDKNNWKEKNIFKLFKRHTEETSQELVECTELS